MSKIKIDLERKIGNVDRRIYSGFIEHLGRCIYGGIYEENSPLSDEHGFRKDVMDAVRPLRMPLLRWPGGNFVSGYHWTDGIGPKEERPRRIELAWHTEESNRFGIDEFIEYCRTIGTEPYICVNMGTGTLDEAQAWVEYCNGTGNTYWANLRRQNGHEEPYNVVYWGLGNEMYGRWQIGMLSAEDYVKKAIEFAKVMQWTDPNIQFISCGLNGWSDWDRIVLEGLASFVRYHSIHIYTGSEDYYSNVFSAHQAERALRNSQAMIDIVRYEQNIEHPIHIAYDEWNIWYRMREADTRLEEKYSLADALAVASYLNSFIRHCNTVKIANLAQLVNVIAPIFTNEQGLFLQTIYHPLRLFSEHMLETALDVFVDSETYTLSPEQEVSPWPHRVGDLGPFKMLDVTVTCDTSERELAIAVVNRDRDHAHTATIQLTDPATLTGVVAYEVNGKSPEVINSFEQPHAVNVQEHRLDLEGQNINYTFAPHSFTLLRARLA
ncbi:alpha-N-arabinofuranosidase [Ktedonospora formicarum]|uniref:non-reducing end alpha-L-arabinofuranosidase n=1 Tax=Ktedonospora formicarum TaxID=2778364 RepID=A0A8J3MVF2_9CHLR|nr:alpha-L-arabinofuranosidase C-terminal domain-containing protein [Ktedonospora formicarum]GHO49270.1 alpha-N-arabinofuranosidase [Ktedonospora formicarum]